MQRFPNRRHHRTPASNNPNLQNIPIRTDLGKEIRRAFIARGPGFTLLAADYSQIELRVMASMSGDKAMISDFEAGHDIHAATAARVYGVDLDHVESEMRRKAKMVNFGIIYGISAFGLSQRLGIPRKEAGEIINNYFLQYPQVKAFMDQTIMDCQEKGYVETLTAVAVTCATSTPKQWQECRLTQCDYQSHRVRLPT